MNWDAIGAISEAVGALAVVVTLAYLATQIRYAKVAAGDANRLTRANGVREMYLNLAQDPSLGVALAKVDPEADAYHRAFAENFGITLEEAIKVDSQSHYYFWLHWGQFASTKSEEDVEEFRNLVRGYYSVPFVNYVWNHSPYAKLLLEPRFVAFVEQVLEEARASE